MPLTACPDTGTLEGLLDDRGANEVAELLQHLETCAGCQQTLENLAAEPIVWTDTAHGLTDATRQEEALHDVLQRLRREECSPADDQALPFLQTSPRPDILGLLGPYEVLQVVGRGGMGIVVKALDPALNRSVAIKVMAPFLAASDSARRRFVREGRAAAAVSHEHIVTVYGVQETGGLPYLVMQWIDGGSLQQYLDRNGPLPVAETVRMAQEIAAGLAAAHAQGLIHRDIKPANILLQISDCRLQSERSDQSAISNLQSAIVKITDFGLARTADDNSVTQEGVVAGTPEYMAPEQARADAVDHRADLFSLGSVIYAMATGQPPFRAATPLGVLRQVCDDTPPSLRSKNPDMPVWLEEFVGRLHAKAPQERFQSAAEVATLLADYSAHLKELTTHPVPPSLPHAAGRRRRRGVAALLACLLALTVSLTMFQPVPEPERPLTASYFYDFRDARPVPSELRLAGPDAVAAMAQEREGLRITLTDKHPSNPVGIAAPFRAHGDFDITVGYDLLRADQPPDQGGVGLELYVTLDTPQDDAVALYRTNRAHDGHGYYCNRITTMPRLGRRYTGKYFPSTCKSGQLRLTRSGAEVVYWVAEGDAFRELYRSEVGRHDVKSIYVRAFPGRPTNAVDIRIKDIRVRAESFVEKRRDVAMAPVPSPAAASRWKVWLMIAVLLTLLTGAALATWHNRRRHVDAGAGEESFFFKCSACGRKLKCKADHAGKKIKCGGCGQGLIVPASGCP